MIRIVTDTVAGLSSSDLEKYDIPMAPQYVVFGEDSYRDVYDISADEFYARLPASPTLPKTSAPSIGDMSEIYDRILKKDPGATIFSIHPSAEFSGTIRAAEGARALLPDADIRVFDSRTASLGLGLMVLVAARMAEAGADAGAILARLETLRDTSRIYFLVDTLEYLVKGGRIGRASHLIGTLLDIKPLLTIRDGVIEDCARYRTHHKAVEALSDRVIDEVRGRTGLHLGVLYSVDEAEAHRIAARLGETLRPDELLMSQIGPSIGVHAGPGVLGICYYVDN